MSISRYSYIYNFCVRTRKSFAEPREHWNLSRLEECSRNNWDQKCEHQLTTFYRYQNRTHRIWVFVQCIVVLKGDKTKINPTGKMICCKSNKTIDPLESPHQTKCICLFFNFLIFNNIVYLKKKILTNDTNFSKQNKIATWARQQKMSFY